MVSNALLVANDSSLGPMRTTGPEGKSGELSGGWGEARVTETD